MPSDEIGVKLGIIRKLCRSQGRRGVLIRQQRNISWLLGGRSHVGLFSVDGVCNLLVCPDAFYLLTSNIEAKRLISEEFKADSVTLVEYPWYEEGARDGLARRLAGGSIVSDDQLETWIRPLRMRMTLREIATYRDLGERTAAAMEHVCHSIRPGMTEFEIASMLMSSSVKAELEPNVVLVASDERAFMYRHPLPTANTVRDYVMLVLVTRYRGLMAALTRYVSFSNLSDDLVRKREDLVDINSALVANTRPGAEARLLFHQLVEDYRRHGYANEWTRHHQGGPIGYCSREYKVTPDIQLNVESGNVYAWNPSLAGFKAEDTILIGESSNENLTLTPNLPSIMRNVAGVEVCTADILIRRTSSYHFGDSLHTDVQST